MATTQDAPASYYRVDDLLASGGRTCSFEFAPPRSPQEEEVLWSSITQLEKLDPSFVSVTYGAGGAMSDRSARSIGVTGRIIQETDLSVVAHLTCVGAALPDITAVAQDFRSQGVNNILALRGDPPEGPMAPWIPYADGLDTAIDLVAHLASVDDFCIGVAAYPYKHPASPDVDHDARILAMKADAGATYAITQLFFDIDAYAALVDRARAHGCDIPIIPGLMPITRLPQIERFTKLNGTPVPASIVDPLMNASSPDDVRRIGIDQMIDLGSKLLDMGAPGIHLFTLNRSKATFEICTALGLDGQGSATLSRIPPQ